MADNQPDGRDVEQDILAAVVELKAQIQTLDVPKRKDFWDRFSIVSSFVGSVLLAAVGFWFTHAYQEQESAERAARESEQQRRAEIELTTKLIPLLTSDDEQQRRLAREVLRSAQRQSASRSVGSGQEVEPADVVTKKQPTDQVLDHFIQVALADAEPDKNRTAATQKIASIALDANAPPDVRERAAEAVSRIAISADAPVEARRIAEDVLRDLRLVTADEAVATIAGQEVSRTINEVMLHHTWRPSIAGFQGEKSVIGMARFAIQSQGWRHAPWHYLIAPDGGVWLGRPLEVPAVNTPGHNQTSVNVTLVLDGDHEHPTRDQQRALGIVLRGLLDKFKLSAKETFGKNHGFHSDYDSTKSCPGKLITKADLIRWIAATGPTKKSEAIDR